MISTSKKFKKAKVKNYKKAKFTIKKLKANKKVLYQGQGLQSSKWRSLLW